MPQRTYRIAGHGDGPLAKKAVDLAAKKRRFAVEVHSTEITESKFRDYLKQLGLATLENLKVHEKTSSINFLKTQSPNSFNHQYAHFTVSALTFYQRREFFAEVYRTLKPGAKFVIIDTGYVKNQYLKELAREKFSLQAVPLSASEVKKLNTPDSVKFAGADFLNEINFNSYSPERKKVWLELWTNLMLHKEKKTSPEVLKAIKTMGQDMGLSSSDKPFVKIVATKPAK